MNKRLTRRDFLRAGGSAAAISAIAGPAALAPQSAKAEPVTFMAILTAAIALKQIYEITIADPAERRNLRELGQSIETLSQQQVDILNELQNVRITLRRELQDAFLNEDLRDLKTLAGQLNMYTEIPADQNTLDVAASHANMLTSRLAQYDSYAAFPALANAAAVQVGFHKMKESSPLEMRAVLRQQQRAFGQWADFSSEGGIDVRAYKSDRERGFKVWRQYDYAPDTAADTSTLYEGDVITAIDGQSANDMDSDTFKGLLDGPIGSTVRLQVKRASGKVEYVKIEREHIPAAITEDGETPLKKLDQDIADLFKKVKSQRNDLNVLDDRDFRVAEYIEKFNIRDRSYSYRAKKVYFDLDIDDDGNISLTERRPDIPKSTYCEPSGRTSTGCSDFEHRYTNNSDETLVYYEIADWMGERTGCLVDDVRDWEYDPQSTVERFIDSRKICIKNYAQRQVNEYNRDLIKLTELMQIKLAMQTMRSSIERMDLDLQARIDRLNAPSPGIAPRLQP